MKKAMIICLVVLFAIPLIPLFFQAVSFGWRWPHILPENYQIEALKTVMKDPKLVEALLMTVWIGIIVLLINLAVGIPAGKVLAFHSFKMKSTIELLLIGPILIPALAIAMGLHITFLKLGWANHWWGVALVHLVPTLPYTIRIFKSGYERLGSKLIEQALLLGVSKRKIFWTLELPLLLPTFRMAVVLILLISFSQYALTAIIGGGSVVTLALIYYPYFHSSNPTMIASFSLVFIVLPIIFLMVFEAAIRIMKVVERRSYD